MYDANVPFWLALVMSAITAIVSIGLIHILVRTDGTIVLRNRIVILSSVGVLVFLMVFVIFYFSS